MRASTAPKYAPTGSSESGGRYACSRCIVWSSLTFVESNGACFCHSRCSVAAAEYRSDCGVAGRPLQTSGAMNIGVPASSLACAFCGSTAIPKPDERVA
jgi:hypothetical protein